MPTPFSDVLRRTVPLLPASMQHEFQALLSPSNLAILVATLVVWAGSHATGVGEIVDVVLLVGGLSFSAWQCLMWPPNWVTF